MSETEADGAEEGPAPSVDSAAAGAGSRPLSERYQLSNVLCGIH